MQTAIEKSEVVLARIAKGDTVQAVESGEAVTLDLSRIDRLVKGFGHEINALGSVIVRRGRLWLALNVSAKGIVHCEAHYAERMEPILRAVPLLLADLDCYEVAKPGAEEWKGSAPVAPTANAN